MRKRLLALASAIAASCICACAQGGMHNAEEDAMSQETTYAKVTVADDREFLKTTYQLSDEMLEDLDCELFVRDYQLRERDYTAEEVWDIIEEMKDYYRDDGTTAIFSIFDEEGGSLKRGSGFCRIGYYRNSGTLVQRCVADLDDGLYYVDDAEPHVLNDNTAEKLKELPDKVDIYSWEQHTEGAEAPSTGNFAWKLVFEMQNGSYAVYDGYTQDMSHLPVNFEELEEAFDELFK